MTDRVACVRSYRVGRVPSTEKQAPNPGGKAHSRQGPFYSDGSATPDSPFHNNRAVRAKLTELSCFSNRVRDVVAVDRFVPASVEVTGRRGGEQVQLGNTLVPSAVLQGCDQGLSNRLPPKAGAHGKRSQKSHLTEGLQSDKAHELINSLCLSHEEVQEGLRVEVNGGEFTLAQERDGALKVLSPGSPNTKVQSCSTAFGFTAEIRALVILAANLSIAPRNGPDAASAFPMAESCDK